MEKGITNGVDATHFGPGAECSRAQIVTFLWRAAGEPKAANTTNPFEDVPADSYYYDAVLWAVEEGITNGLDETHFGPNAKCSRTQVVTFLWRAAGEPDATIENPFVDVVEGSFYYDAVLWAVENGVTNGVSNDTFGISETCNRGQAVTFLYRAFAE